MSQRQPEKIPDLYLEQLALDELPDDVRAEIAEQHNGTEADDTQRILHELERSNERILQRYPRGWMAERIAERLRGQSPRKDGPKRVSRRRRRRTAAVGLVSAGAIAFALLVWFAPPATIELGSRHPNLLERAQTAEITRIKGVPHLVIHRKAGESTVQLDADAEVRPRDWLQVCYVAAGRTHGVVLSIDGNRAVTLHLPESAQGSTALVTSGMVRLDRSYELDDAPGFERFFFVTSHAPLDVEQILATAHDLVENDPLRGDLSLPDGCEQSSITLRKVSP